MSTLARCARALVAAVLMVPGTPLAAQPATPPSRPAPVADTTQAGALRVFVDCEARGCDFDFFRDQVRWVNFVRDRLYSDVLLLVTSLQTGAGGSEVTIAAIGNDRYRGRADTTIVFIGPNDASDIARRKLARTFTLMLAPYAAKTSIASRLDLTYRAPTEAQTTPQAVKDPWDFWVYRIAANGYGSGEKRQSFRNGNLSTSANRVTARWKIALNASLGYNESRFSLKNGSDFTNLLRDYGGTAVVVRSVGEHWAAGVTASGEYSDFNNYERNVRVTPALEWNYFPYKDFTRRQLTAFYTVGMASFRYKERTIYDRIEETRPLHSLNVGWNAKQPWGSVNWSVFGSQYLHDTQFYSYGSSAFMDIRIAKGLAFNFGGSYSRVNDQLYLPRGELDDTEIIARQQALATNYRFFLSFGMSYTFGSIYNTVVNPRFNRSGGGMMFF